MTSPSWDVDGDGLTDKAVWLPGNGIWYILLSGSPGSYTSTQWGLDTDVAISPSRQSSTQFPDRSRPWILPPDTLIRVSPCASV